MADVVKNITTAYFDSDTQEYHITSGFRALYFDALYEDIESKEVGEYIPPLI